MHEGPTRNPTMAHGTRPDRQVSSRHGPEPAVPTRNAQNLVVPKWIRADPMGEDSQMPTGPWTAGSTRGGGGPVEDGRLRGTAA
ncbi:hypothetical protein HDU87_003504, partial [Geranomyces variabilis]